MRARWAAGRGKALQSGGEPKATSPEIETSVSSAAAPTLPELETVELDVELLSRLDSLIQQAGEPQTSPVDAESVLDSPSLISERVDGGNAKRARYEVVDISAGATGGSASVSFTNMSISTSLAREAMRVTDIRQFKFPWEKGRMSKIFGPLETAGASMPSLLPGRSNVVQMAVEVDDQAAMQTAVVVSAPVRPSGMFEKVVRKVHGEPFLVERASKRSLAVELWWDLLADNLECHEPGRLALLEADGADIKAHGLASLDACFAVKSPGTLLKRYYSLRSYFHWDDKEDDGRHLPLKESKAWAYLLYLKRVAAPPTKATSFMEAVRFCSFVLHMSGTESILQSLRVKGLAAQMYATKRPWKPADTLSVSQVMKLHKGLQDKKLHIIDRVIVGHFLHMLYGRARWSDLVAVQHGALDDEEEFLELESQWHKGAKSADVKAKLLPIVSPARGIDGTNWAAEYIAIRKETGLELPSKQPAPMLPAPKGEVPPCWSSRYLSSLEGNRFLQKFFADEIAAGNRISTHSLKATGISWCAKMGVSAEHRSVLGRHATQGTTTLYSRDVISAALRDFLHVISSINKFHFMPDKTRSGMITPVLEATGAFGSKAPETPVPPVGEIDPDEQDWEKIADPNALEEDVSEQDGLPAGEPVSLHSTEVVEESSSDSTSSDEESSGSENEESPEAGHVSDASVIFNAAAKFYINTNSLVVHEIKTGETFKCGRRLGHSYCPLNKRTGGLSCSRCFPEA